MESNCGNRISLKKRRYTNEVRPSIISKLAIPHYLLTRTEKNYLLCAERGDCASVQRIIQEYQNKPDDFNINCLDPLNRSALIIALEKENINLIELLLNGGIEVKDALLHAITEEYVEGVEILLQWEEKTHVEGEPYSWEEVEKSASIFTPDITPVILAAHKNNYEILKLLLDRGATLPIIHDIRCGCDECTHNKEQDSLRFSQSRINAYRALISPSLICLSSKDPLLTAMELYWELKKLAKLETEFKSEYNVMKLKDMRRTVQTFSTSLLDHLRTSNELEIVLNYDADLTKAPWEPGERQTLDRLKLAIKYKLKSFVAHANVQQLLASIWYQGLPGFRRKTMFYQILQVLKIACMFPMYSVAYVIRPTSKMGQFLKKPFVKFVCDSASYGVFLGLLALASQRVESSFLELFGDEYLEELVREWARKERGSFFGLVESVIVLFVISLIYKEIKTLYVNGLLEYISDLWNILDFFANIGYVTWISLRLVAAYVVHREYLDGIDPWYSRDKWDKYDPHMLSECAFASSMILSFMKLVNIFSVNPHLGPLQISLGRMIIDIIKFFLIYTLVLFAFGCGLNQLLWYFAGLEMDKCYHVNPNVLPDFEHEEKACTIWRRFANLFETSQSLFWASFGLVDLAAFDLTGIKSFTRFWALLIFGCYSVINIIVLLNMLIAMMSSSYQIISERSDTEWKYARSKLFISFFEEGDTLPPPFNLFPSTKIFRRLFKFKNNKITGSIMKRKETEREKSDLRYDITMQLLVRRYITNEQKKLEEFSVTEDDIAEVRHDISTFRFEIIDLFRRNNFKVPKVVNSEAVAQGKKDRLMERRIIKDFQIGMVEGVINEIITSEQKVTNIFGKIAKAIGKGDSKKKNWNKLVRNASIAHDPIGSTQEKQRKIRQQSVRRYIIDYQGENPLHMDTDKLVEYNPQLASINPMARIAYAKFKMNLIKQEYEGLRELSRESTYRERKDSRGDSINIARPRPTSIKLTGTPGILSTISTESTVKPESLEKSKVAGLSSTIKEDGLEKSKAGGLPSTLKKEGLELIGEVRPTSKQIFDEEKEEKDESSVKEPHVITIMDDAEDETNKSTGKKKHTVLTVESPSKSKFSSSPKKIAPGKWL